MGGGGGRTGHPWRSGIWGAVCGGVGARGAGLERNCETLVRTGGLATPTRYMYMYGPRYASTVHAANLVLLGGASRSTAWYTAQPYAQPYCLPGKHLSIQI
eukprot:SAG31_NODE_4851_length_2905_cov_11.373169_1_plen_101_part_00